MVARRAHNPKVAGSNPAPATLKHAAFGRRLNVHPPGIGGPSMFRTDAQQARGWTMADTWSSPRGRAVEGRL